jgi:putative ABC transport system permease protein
VTGLLGLALRGVLGHARAWVGVLLGVMLASALLGAALGTGEALRAALAARTAARAGPVEVVLSSEEGFFREALAVALGGEPALRLDAVASAEDAVAPIQLVGLADSGALGAVPRPADGGASLGRRLAERLAVEAEARLSLRFERPSLLPRDVAIMQAEQRIKGFSSQIVQVMDEGWPATLAVDADPLALPAVTLPLDLLQQRTGDPALAGMANLALIPAAAGDVEARLREALTAADVGLEVTDGVVSTRRVVLPPVVADALVDGIPGSERVMTWFAGALRGPAREIPYLFVAGRGERPEGTVALHPETAARLGVQPGEQVVVRYPVLGRARAVEWREESLRFDGELITLDPSFTPHIEGLTGKERCADWNPGLPVALDRIGPEDEAWWAAHGATPQAVVSLATAQRLFESAWGDTTSVRLPAGAGPAEVDAVLRTLSPAALGLTITPLAAQLRAAERPSNDLGALFLGFELTLLASTAALVVMLAAFALEDRRRQWWLLTAVGWGDGRVRALVLAEASLVAAAGALLGVPLALLGRDALLAGLEGAWSGAVVGLDLRGGGQAGAALGAVLAAALVVVAVGLTWERLRRPPRPAGDGRRWAWVAAAAAVAAVGLAVGVEPARSPTGAAMFFVAGALALLALAAGTRASLSAGAVRSRGGLAWSAAAWRPGRAVNVVGLLGSGTFVVVGVGLGAGMPAPDPSSPSSGTGGFARYGESLIPMVEGLAQLDGVEMIAARRRDGDDASCLQLGSAATPHLIGLDPARMVGRFGTSSGASWEALRPAAPGQPTPVLGDASTVTWGLHLGVGDVLTLTDGSGAPFDVEIVGLTVPSLLQGALVMDEVSYLRHFPGDGGPRVFLIDGEEPAVEAAAAAWTRDGADLGLSLQTGAQRLELFSAVEHTWIAVFRALGLLGLVLGAAGVGVVVTRNLQERRLELATLAAVGWTPAQVAGLVALEHLALLAAGLAGGAAAGALAAWPALRAAEAVAWGEVAAGLLAAAVVGAASVAAASARAPRAADGRLLLGEGGGER